MHNIIDKAKKIKLLIMDVDGVMTNGRIYYHDNGEQSRGFHVHDGMGIKLLHSNDIATAIISAKDAANLKQRAQDLGITHVYTGQSNKLPAYEKIKLACGLNDDAIAYIGDDLPDLPILKRAGLAITVPQASKILQDNVDMVTQKKGGKGAIREVCEIILSAKDLLEDTLKPYIEGTSIDV